MKSILIPSSSSSSLCTAERRGRKRRGKKLFQVEKRWRRHKDESVNIDFTQHHRRAREMRWAKSKWAGSVWRARWVWNDKYQKEWTKRDWRRKDDFEIKMFRWWMRQCSMWPTLRDHFATHPETFHEKLKILLGSEMADEWKLQWIRKEDWKVERVVASLRRQQRKRKSEKRKCTQKREKNGGKDDFERMITNFKSDYGNLSGRREEPRN